MNMYFFVVTTYLSAKQKLLFCAVIGNFFHLKTFNYNSHIKFIFCKIVWSLVRVFFFFFLKIIIALGVVVVVIRCCCRLFIEIAKSKNINIDMFVQL